MLDARSLFYALVRWSHKKFRASSSFLPDGRWVNLEEPLGGGIKGEACLSALDTRARLGLQVYDRSASTTLTVCCVDSSGQRSKLWGWEARQKVESRATYAAAA